MTSKKRLTVFLVLITAIVLFHMCIMQLPALPG